MAAMANRRWAVHFVGAGLSRDGVRSAPVPDIKWCQRSRGVDFHGMLGSGAAMCLTGDRVMGARCLSWVWRWGGNRAPPARRIASYARSYICFGPVTSVPARATALFVRHNIASCQQGGRAQMPQASLARNKCRSERSSRCAARAALDLIGAENAKPGTWWPQIQAPGIHNPPEKAEDTLAPIARAARALGM
jgi:hypothetical protein